MRIFRNQQAFTTKESILLIASVVVLSLIAIALFKNLQYQAQKTAIMTDLTNISTQLEDEIDKTKRYPKTIDDLTQSGSTSLQYSYDSKTNGYCLTASNAAGDYYVTHENKTPIKGTCAGHVAGGYKNLVTDPSFQETEGEVTVRRNHVTRPIPNGEGWESSTPKNNTINYNKEGSSDGNDAFEIITGDDSDKLRIGTSIENTDQFFEPGDPVLGTVAIFVPEAESEITGTVEFEFALANKQIVSVSGEAQILKAGWNTVTSLVQVPNKSAGKINKVYFVTDRAVNAGEVWKATKFMVTGSSVLLDYFDGNISPDKDLAAQWIGAKDASASILEGKTFSSANAQNGSSITVQSGEWSQTGFTSARIIPNSVNSNNSWFAPDGISTSEMTLGMQPGKTYTAVAKVHLSKKLSGTLNPNALAINVRYNSSPGYQGATELVSVPVENLPGEYVARVTFILPIDALWAHIRLFNGASAGNGDVWWDDFSLVEGQYTGSPLSK